MKELAQVDIGKQYAFGNIGSLGEGIRLLVVPTFSVVSVIVIFYFLIGAFKYLISKGDKNEIDAARNMMVHSIIGFIILIFAFFIMQYLTEFFGTPDIIGK